MGVFYGGIFREGRGTFHGGIFQWVFSTKGYFPRRWDYFSGRRFLKRKRRHGKSTCRNMCIVILKTSSSLVVFHLFLFQHKVFEK